MPRLYKWHVRVRLFKLPADVCEYDTDPEMDEPSGRTRMPEKVCRTLDEAIEFVMQMIDSAHMPPARVEGHGSAAAIRMNNTIRNALHRDGGGYVTTRLTYNVSYPEATSLHQLHMGKGGVWRALVDVTRV